MFHLQMAFFTLADGFFVRRVKSDCLADKFGGQLEIFTPAVTDGFADQIVGT